LSEETAQALAAAEAAEARQHRVVRQFQDAVLEVVATALASHADDHARTITQHQPERTKAIGAEGLTALRGDLAKVAALVAGDLRQAHDSVKWPHIESSGRKRDVRDAIFEDLYPRMARIDEVFRIHGYQIETHNGMSPYSMSISDNRFLELDLQLSHLADLRRKTEEARAADDRSAVDSLWDESSG
jgi:hypothetical protein